MAETMADAIVQWLLDAGAITKRQLKRATDELSRRRNATLPEVLVDMQLVERAEVQAAKLALMATQKPAESTASLQARQVLSMAFRSVSREVERLEKRAAEEPKRGVQTMRISPDDED